jgi:hypothetical protein
MQRGSPDSSHLFSFGGISPTSIPLAIGCRSERHEKDICQHASLLDILCIDFGWFSEHICGLEKELITWIARILKEDVWVGHFIP